MIFNIQRWSLHDGPGIRTTVFFKGCPLRCLWCCNPESWAFEKQLFFYKKRCTDCNSCVENCPEKAIETIVHDKIIDLNKCNLCFNCSNGCLSDALEPVGYDLTVDKIFEAIERDSIFYRSSGGGITFSGGEPFSQLKVLNDLVKKCKYAGINTSVETSGFFSLEKARGTIDLIDHLYIDLKHIDDTIHNNLTGVSNRTIIQNIIDIDKSGKKIIIRIPLIKDLTDTDENIAGILELTKQLDNLLHIELMTYHELGVSKYEALGLLYNTSMTQSENTKSISATFNRFGIKCL